MNVHGAFLPVVAPASALPGAKLEHYKDEEEFLFALADALHEEYKAIVDAGLYVQIDDAFLPYMYERMVPPMSTSRIIGAGRRCASTRSTTRCAGMPEERSRYHICWGSWNGPHVIRRANQGHRRPRCCRSASAIIRSKRPIRATTTSGGCGRP